LLRRPAANDIISGLDGDDIICGGADGMVNDGDEGNDTLLGGSGGDHIDGGEDIDSCDLGSAGLTQINCELEE
jgi:Ca2+-binding RTX toxin-like protein